MLKYNCKEKRKTKTEIKKEIHYGGKNNGNKRKGNYKKRR
jgi:hypothetical protein